MMKQTLLLLLLLLLAGGGVRAQALLVQESFETDGNGSHYSASTVASGNSNIYFYRASLPVPGFLSTSTVTNIRDANGNSGGTYFWASENVRRDASNNVRGNPPANLTLNAINVTGKSNFSVKVALADAAANNTTGTGWETNDFVRIQYRFDGGTWTTPRGGQFVGTRDEATGTPSFGRLVQDADVSGAADPGGATLTQALTDYTFDIPGSGNTLEVRVQIDQDGASEEFGFDAIRVYGSAAASAAPVLAGIESTTLAYAEGQAATQITNTLTITDDGTQLSGATIAISNNYQSSEDRLLFSDQNGISTTGFNQATGMLTLTGTASLANYQAALRSVQYIDIDAADAFPGTRTVSFSVTDATNVGSSTVSRNVAVTTALDAPGGLPYAEDLENDGEGTRYATNKATATLVNGRYFNRTNVASEPGGQWHTTGSAATTISGIDKSYYWWVSGSNVLSNGVGTFITKQTNTAGYFNLNFSVKLAASNNVWENGQYLRVFYRLGGSSGTWQPLLSFRSTDQTTTTSQSSTTGNLRQDANPATTTGVPTGAQLTPTLTTYSAALPASANGQLVDFWIEALSIASDGVGEVIAFDNLQLTGSPIVAPTVTTGTTSTITTTTAAVNSNTLSSDGGASLTDYGVVYVAGTGTPTTANSKGQAGTSSPGSFPASFSVSLSGLTAGTQYTARAYAANSVGTSYGANVSFTTVPNVPVVRMPANGSIVNATTPTYTGTAQANATITVLVDGASIGTTTANASGNWSLNQATALAQGSHTVRATAAINGSAASALSSPTTFTVDTTRPSVVISSTAGGNNSTTTTTPIPFTVTFSESVAGFSQSSVVVTGGTPSGFSGTGSTYTFNVTPASSGTTVTANVAANTVQDQAGNGNTASALYSLTYLAPNIVLSPSALPKGVVSISYSQTITASSGTTPYSYAITAGALPAGLTLASNGVLTGTPTAAGSFSFTVTATDASAAPGPASGSRDYTLTITYPDLVISTGGQTIPAGTYNSITVQRGGEGTLAGPVTVSGDVTVQSGGILQDGCALLSGAGSFTLAAGGTLGICSPQGISSSGATGAVQVTGTRSFSTDAIYSYTGTGAQVTGTGLPATVRTLVLLNTAGLTLTNNLTTSVAATFTTGVLTTGALKLTLGSGATLSEDADSYVTGTVQATRTLNTAGSPEAFGGLGLMLTPTGSTLPGSTLVTRVTGTALRGAGSSTSVKRYFDIEPTVNTGLNVALILTARDDERNGIAPTNLRLFKSADNGSSWQQQPATSSTATASGLTTYSASLSGISDFSLWTLGDAAAPLPVTLTGFQALVQDANRALLRWATASELRSAYFAVERSLDGHTFIEVGRIAAAGTSLSAHTYELRDPLPLTGLTYYRLRQVDTDKSATYSPVITLAPSTQPVVAVSVYPNPRIGTALTSVGVQGLLNQALTVQVTNMLGRTVSTQQFIPTMPQDALALYLPAGLATGIYSVSVNAGKQTWTTRLVVVP